MRFAFAFAFLLSLTAHAAPGDVQDPILVRVDLLRSEGVCSGAAHYTMAAADSAVNAVVGARSRVLLLSIPCARLDAVDALLPLPSSLSGKLLVRTERVELRLRADGVCVADVARLLRPTNADVRAALGDVTSIQQINPIPCVRLTQALTGARTTDPSDWPVTIFPLPVPLAP